MSKNSLVLPEVFVQRIKQTKGIDYQSFFNSLEETPPVSVRTHPVKSNDAFSENEKVSWCALGRYLKERPVFTLDPLFHSGTYYVQEAGSMLIEQLFNIALEGIPEPLVLDLCASPGGKTTHLLSHLNGKGLLVSNETISKRNQILLHNIIKWGYMNSIVTQSGAEAFQSSGIQFDLVLVDAPCSGEGLFRKDPEACRHWSKEQAELCSIRQKGILENIIDAVKPGGYLIYSTCTYGENENDLQAKLLIEKYGFVNCTPTPPNGIMATTSGWQAWPHLVKSEGFWCTLLQKPDVSVKKSEKRLRHEIKTVKFDQAQNWLKDPAQTDFVQQGETILAINGLVSKYLTALKTSCYIRNAGISVGTIKNKDLIPSPDIALSLELSGSIKTHNLDRKQALHYLHGDTLLEAPEGNGWFLITYENKGLGWAKYISGRWNNYYPKDWRIAMKPDQWEEKK